MRIINPLGIPEKDLPLIVLVDDTRSLIPFLIKSHSSGNYNHIEELYKKDTIATQGFGGFINISIKKHLKKNLRLKFFKKKNITFDQKETWINLIENELKQSWWKRRYDFLGIVGQAFKIPFLNNTWTRYCSERVIMHLITAFKKNYPMHPSPSKINELLMIPENGWELYGYYFED